MLLREVIDRLCLERIGRVPNLDSPQGYNDLIQWLKLYDQTPDHVVACDKWAVRDWVAARAGEDVLIPAKLDLPPMWVPAVAKCTHDSGSATPITCAADLSNAEWRLKRRLRRRYGIEKGEWAYRFVPPRIIVEKAMPTPVVDFKFHCAHAAVKWCQVIAGRSEGVPRETILNPYGERLPLHMDHKMLHAPAATVFPGNDAWDRLTSLAVRLAAGWRYVRVDLYWSMGRAWFGELTFWPLAGCYQTKDEPEFGAMLDLDLSYRYPSIVQ